MLISERDAASVIMSVVLDTCPLFYLTVQCLVSRHALTRVLLAVTPVADFSAKSFSSEIPRATPVSASRCVAANSDHFLVRTFVDFVRAWSSSSVVRASSSSIFLSLDAFVFFRD